MCYNTKCRGKKANGEWAYGSFFARGGSQYLWKDNELNKIVGETLGVRCLFVDRQEKEIYEDDIIFDLFTKEIGVMRYGEYEEKDGQSIYGWFVEKWHKDRFSGKSRNFVHFADSNVIENFLVIGNTYDDTDILEESRHIKLEYVPCDNSKKLDYQINLPNGKQIRVK